MNDPSEDELHRTSAVLANAVAAHGSIPSNHVAPAIAIGLLVWGRSPHNVITQWEIDSESTMKEAIALLQRHVEIIKWGIKVCEPDELEKFTAMVPAQHLVELEQGVREPARVMQIMTEHFPKLKEYIASDPEL